MRWVKRLRCWSELEMEGVLARLLRTGVIVSAAIVLVGLVAYLVASGSAAPSYRVFKGEPAELRSIPGILGDAARLRRLGLIQFGLLLLLATPVARVAFSTFSFACQKDRIYVVVTLVVLAVLAYSIAGGFS
jgi:uncharacterized membrane protein